MTPYAHFHNQREYENAQPGLAEYALIAPKSFFAPGGLKFPVAPFNAPGDEITIKEPHVFKDGLGFLYFVAAPDKNELNTTTVGDKGFRKANTEAKYIFPGSTPAQHEQLRKLLNVPLIAISKDGQCSADMHYQLGNDCTAAYITTDFKSGTSEGGIKGFEVTLTFADAPLFYAAPLGPEVFPDAEDESGE